MKYSNLRLFLPFFLRKRHKNRPSLVKSEGPIISSVLKTVNYFTLYIKKISIITVQGLDTLLFRSAPEEQYHSSTDHH